MAQFVVFICNTRIENEYWGVDVVKENTTNPSLFI